MLDIAARNRAIKSNLERVFGRGSVKVTGARGTAYGYVTVRIDHAPLDWEQAGILKGNLKQRMRDAGIDLGFAYTDDTCERTTDQCRIEFNRCLYRYTERQTDGSVWGCREEDDRYELVRKD